MDRRKLLLKMSGSKTPMYNKIMALSPDLYWPLNDASGVLLTEATGKTSDTLELALNGGFETASGNDFTSWTETPGTGGTIEAEGTIVHAGSLSCKITQATPTPTNCYVSQFVNPSIMQHGRTYEISFWTRGDGTNAGRYAIKDQTHNQFFVAFPTSTGVTGTDWTQVTTTVTVTGTIDEGAVDFYIYFIGPAAAGGVAYFDDLSIIGKNFTNPGILVGSGSSYKSESIGGSQSLLLDGGFVNIFSRGLAKLFAVRDPITIFCWAKPNFVWATEGTSQDLWTFQGVNSSQVYVNFYSSAAHGLIYRFYGSGTSINRTITDTPSGWFSTAQVISSNVQKPYYNGVAQTTDNGAAWAAGNLTAANLFNSAATTPGDNWHGNVAHLAIWFRELSPAEILKISIP